MLQDQVRFLKDCQKLFPLLLNLLGLLIHQLQIQ